MSMTPSTHERSMDSTQLDVDWDAVGTVGHSQLADLLRTFGGFLPVPLEAVFDVDEYATKLLDRAEIGLVFDGDAICGVVTMYANDPVTRYAHVTVLAVRPESRGRGIGRALLRAAMARAKALGMTTLGLDVDDGNDPALALYAWAGLKVRETNDQKSRMVVDL